VSNAEVLANYRERTVYPVPDMEAKLTRLWAELLKLEEVGIHDDYFALGGNSLLAVNLMAQIETQLGAKLPLTSILEAPTVAEFARLLESQGSHNPLVLIRKGGDKTPLFLVHDADGETMLYRNLALHLDPEQSVYGLKAYSTVNHPILHTSIGEMSAYHILTMRRVQAQGPYLLGGLCAGGLIAFEMALQLERDGEQVAMVALIDAGDVEAKERPLRWAKQRLTRVASTLEQGKGRSVPQRAVSFIGTWLRKAKNFAKYQAESRLQMIRDHSRMRLLRLYLKLGRELPAFLQRISVRTAYGFARRGYRPATSFNGELLLYRATSGVGIDEPFSSRYIDPLMGWSPRATSGVRAFDVPGGHSSMLQEPNVQVLAAHLRAYMDEALRATDRARTAKVTDSATIVRDANAEAVVEDAPDVNLSSRPSRPAQLLLVSAMSREGMESGAVRLAEHLEKLGEQELPDVSYTLAVGRPAFEWRRAVVAGSRAEAIERLRKGTGKGVWSSSQGASSRPVAFVLAGVGEQTAGAGRGLYEGEPAFRAAADRCAEILQPLMRLDIRESMFTPSQQAGNWLRGDAGVLKETRVSQPAAFVLDWALAEMWLSWGIRPTAVLGYSVGEYAAATVAGVLRLEDALVMVARRAEWIEELAEPGVMLAVPLTEAEIQPRLGEGVWVAAVNSPQATVVGGREDAIRLLEEELLKSDVVTRRVASDQGSHTPLLDPVRPHLKQLAEGLSRQPPQIPMVSNVTGSWMSASESQDANHWCEHMCGTLRFEDGIGELLSTQDRILLEVGPGAGLSAMVRQHPRFGREMMSRVLSSLPGAWERVADRENVVGVLGRLWVEGVDADWKGYFAGEDRRQTVVPADPSPAARGTGYAATTEDRAQAAPARDRSTVNLVESRQGGFLLGRGDIGAGGTGHSQRIDGPIGPDGIRDPIEVL
jgi:thioesterase domain-containing protein/malonyl CoA-acyl carrier protein transacylase/acyl carrier protein